MDETTFKINFITAHLIKINFGQLEIFGSDLTDIPITWLQSIYFSIKNNLPFCIEFDDENIRNSIFSSVEETILYKPYSYFYKLTIGNKEFTYLLYREMKQYQNNWYNWYSKIINDPKDKINKINQLFNSIEALLLLKKLK